MKINRVRKAECPGCNAPLDSTAATHQHKPKAGDISICFYCNAVLQFQRDFSLKKMTAAQIDRLPIEVRENIANILFAVKQANTLNHN